jgi:GNAT superfamily N-acetyltransferase
MPPVEVRALNHPHDVNMAAVAALYAAVGWTAYTRDPAVVDAQRRGVGAALMAAVAQRYRHVRQHVLLTDDEPGQRAFYESLGYRETRDFGEAALRAFVRFN